MYNSVEETLQTEVVKSEKILPNICYPAWVLRISKNSEIPCKVSPKAELVSLKFCNASSTTQCTKHNVNVGTKSTFHHENNFVYTLTCSVHNVNVINSYASFTTADDDYWNVLIVTLL